MTRNMLPISPPPAIPRQRFSRPKHSATRLARWIVKGKKSSRLPVARKRASQTRLGTTIASDAGRRSTTANMPIAVAPIAVQGHPPQP
jgi:hypothetical protein